MTMVILRLAPRESVSVDTALAVTLTLAAVVNAICLWTYLG